MPKIILGLFIIATLLVATGCDSGYPESTRVFEVGTLQPMNGSSVRLFSITSNKRHFNEKQDDVRQGVVMVVNGGHYNVITVKTAYSSGYLTAADIVYTASGRGAGNDVRVRFIQSSECCLERKAADINPRLTEMVNSGTHDIMKINTVYEQGYLIAAEVYYREKQSP